MSDLCKLILEELPPSEKIAVYLLDPIDHRYRNTHDLFITKILKLACIAEVNQQIEYAFDLLAWLCDQLIQTDHNHEAEMIRQISRRAEERYTDPPAN